MSKFRYRDNIPAELLPVAERIFAPLEFLIPAWCNHVYVHAEHENQNDEDANATINTYYDYRWASIRLQPSWFAQPDNEKWEDAAHELIHILRAPVDNWAREVIDRLAPKDADPKLNGILSEELRARAEAATQDTMFVIFKLLESK